MSSDRNLGQSEKYIYGTAARAYMPKPDYDADSEGLHRVSHRRKRAPKLDVVSVLLVGVTFAAVLITGIFYLNLNFKATYHEKNVVQLQREVAEMKKVNTAMNEKIEDSVDLNKVYKRATKSLGMKMATKDQIVSYNSRKSTQIRTYGDIPTE